MEHVAILRKSWRFLPKIRSGEKRIESRWYDSRRAPWNRIRKGETIYFKDSGESITLRAKVGDVIQYAELDPHRIRSILKRYGGVGGIGIDDFDAFFERVKEKRYCILIFLEEVEDVVPFDIDKTGFGTMSAWISVPSISDIKK